MANLLRQIVAGPRAQHAEGLDLCYVTPNLIATSGPSQTYPQRAYRNPLDRLVAFLDRQHGDRWAIWEFRAEGTGYPDAAVYGRIRHYPWPDHHPPPFRLVPLILASMRQWLARSPDHVAVVHCKAGKGRSGTVACSYLVAECGWAAQAALDRFTERRMRPRFAGAGGVSIPSQLRWIAYVDRWARQARHGQARHGQAPRPPYADRPVEVVEVRVWGLRPGVQLAVEGYVDEGKQIRVLHTFRPDERRVFEGGGPGAGGVLDLVTDMGGWTGAAKTTPSATPATTSNKTTPSATATTTTPTTTPSTPPTPSATDPGGRLVVFTPATPVRVPGSDVNVAIERRVEGLGLAVVTSVAHAWFNAYFEGRGPEQGGRADDAGVFVLDWDRFDGIKGSSQRGSRAADRVAVVWRVAGGGAEPGEGVAEPGEPAQAPDADVPQMRPADWTGAGSDGQDPDAHKQLGLRRGADGDAEPEAGDPLLGLRTSGPDGEVLEVNS